MSDTIRDLCDLLGSAGITFSINCVSGCLPGGRSECQCWRCRGVGQSEEDPEWAAKSRSISDDFRDEQFKFLRGAG